MATNGKVRIETDCIGRGKIWLNGEDISQYVCGFYVHGNTGSLNMVELRLVAGVEIDAETQQLITYRTEAIPPLSPNDVVVITTKQRLSGRAFDSIQVELKKLYPDNKVLLLDEATTLSTIK
jgi:hypothetical protein